MDSSPPPTVDGPDTPPSFFTVMFAMIQDPDKIKGPPITTTGRATMTRFSIGGGPSEHSLTLGVDFENAAHHVHGCAQWSELRPREDTRSTGLQFTTASAQEQVKHAGSGPGNDSSIAASLHRSYQPEDRQHTAFSLTETAMVNDDGKTPASLANLPDSEKFRISTMAYLGDPTTAGKLKVTPTFTADMGKPLWPTAADKQSNAAYSLYPGALKLRLDRPRPTAPARNDRHQIRRLQ